MSENISDFSNLCSIFFKRPYELFMNICKYSTSKGFAEPLPIKNGSNIVTCKMIVKMKNLPKPSLIEERNFPFETSISYGVEEGFHELHWHNEIEICYIKHGTGNYLINGIDYSFTEGDIFVINNDDIHLCYNDKELIMQVTMFDPFFIGSGSANPFDVEYLRIIGRITHKKYKEFQQK